MGDNSLIKKLRGYQRAYRDRFFLLYNKTLTQEEFILYEVGIAITTWDKSKEGYGTFQATNDELSEILGWDSGTTALRHKNSLIKKGLFVQVNKYLIKPKEFEKWQHRISKAAKIQIQTAKIQPTPANLEEVPAKMQEKQGYQNSYPLLSFKGNLSLSKEASKEENNESLSEVELDRIISDLDKQDSGSFDFASQKNLDQLTPDRQLATIRKIFGEGARWKDEVE